MGLQKMKLTEENNTGRSVTRAQQHPATDSAENVKNAHTDETVQYEDTLISVENTKTPYRAPGVSEFMKSDASTTPQLNNNSPDPEQLKGQGQTSEFWLN